MYSISVYNTLSLIMAFETGIKPMPIADTVKCYMALCYSRIDIPQKLNRYLVFNNQYWYRWGFESTWKCENTVE